jgi:hypothetical protein
MMGKKLGSHKPLPSDISKIYIPVQHGYNSLVSFFQGSFAILRSDFVIFRPKV